MLLHLRYTIRKSVVNGDINCKHAYVSYILQNSSDALIAATAYFDLFLRSITEPKLMRVFLKFVLQENFDEVRILHSLFQRIDAKNEVNR